MTDQSRTPRTDELIREMAADGLDMADRETFLQDFARALELEAAERR